MIDECCQHGELLTNFCQECLDEDRKQDNSRKRCFGKQLKCPNIPVYITVIKAGLGQCFDGAVWCEECMGDEFRKGNPYLKLLEVSNDRV